MWGQLVWPNFRMTDDPATIDDGALLRVGCRTEADLSVLIQHASSNAVYGSHVRWADTAKWIVSSEWRTILSFETHYCDAGLNA